MKRIDTWPAVICCLRLRVVVVVLGLALFVPPSVLHAAPVTFAFTGTVQNVFDGLGSLGGLVHVGTAFSGAYTFDTDTPNSAPPISEGDMGLYHHDAPPAGVRVDVDRFTFRSVPKSPDFDMIVNDNFGFTGADEYGFVSRKNEAEGLLPSPIDRISINWFAASLRGEPLAGVALPTTPPDLGRFDGNMLTIQGECTLCGAPNAYFRIKGPLTALVPEPPAAVLAVVAMLGLFVFVRLDAGVSRRL